MFIDVSSDRTRIEQIQRMLRYLSFAYDDESLRVSVNGAYDPSTEAAVRYFQNTNDLPETGVVDLLTWDTVVALHDDEVRARAPVYIYPIPRDPYHVNRTGERSDVIMILQVILGALRLNYDYPTVPVSGVYGRETVEAVRYFQRINGLPVTGEADRETWRRLSEEYNKSIAQ